MASEKKIRKISKKRHWGRGKSWLKSKGKGVKRVSFYTPSDRQINKGSFNVGINYNSFVSLQEMSDYYEYDED